MLALGALLGGKVKSVGQTGWLDFVDGFRYLREAPFILFMSLVKGAGFGPLLMRQCRNF